MCQCFDRNTSQVLDVQFGDGQTCLKLVSVVITRLELHCVALVGMVYNLCTLVASAAIQW